MAELVDIRAGAAQARHAKRLRHVQQCELDVREDFMHAAALRAAAHILGPCEFSCSAFEFAHRLEVEALECLQRARADMERVPPAATRTRRLAG